jgi:hypothetical protein
MLANLDTRGTACDWLELGADAGWGIELEIEHVLRGRATLQIDQDNALGLARSDVRAGAFLHCKETRQVEVTAQERKGARLQGFPASEPIAAESRTSQQCDHGDFSTGACGDRLTPGAHRLGIRY